MTNDEIKDKQEETLNQLKKYNKQRKTEIVDESQELRYGDMNDEEKRTYKQHLIDTVSSLPKEVFEVLEKFVEENQDLPTLDDRSIASVDEVAELQNEVSADLTDDHLKLTLVHRPEEFTLEAPSEDKEIEVKPLISHICPYCGQLAYQNQLHGLGYCREKAQYEQ